MLCLGTAGLLGTLKTIKLDSIDSPGVIVTVDVGGRVYRSLRK